MALATRLEATDALFKAYDEIAEQHGHTPTPAHRGYFTRVGAWMAPPGDVGKLPLSLKAGWGVGSMGCLGEAGRRGDGGAIAAHRHAACRRHPVHQRIDSD